MTDKEKELIEQVALTYGYSYEEVNESFQKVKNVILYVIDLARETLKEIADLITKNNFYDKCDYNWNVPMDTTRVSQVRVPNVKLPRIRSLI